MYLVSYLGGTMNVFTAFLELDLPVFFTTGQNSNNTIKKTAIFSTQYYTLTQYLTNFAAKCMLDIHSYMIQETHH